MKHPLCSLPVALSFSLLCVSASLCEISSAADQRPNVILMITDDQGIGDFGVMGNELIETPNIDAMAAKSGSLTTFYVSPVCSPTRASLMTGRWNQRTRCIDTWLGRSMMDPDEYTIAEALKAAGYRTGLFGKWHLGDCYPMRPQDQGFDEVLMHRGGGLAQPSEPLENEKRYTDPILFDESGAAIQAKSFCTDVYFDAAMEFIDAGAKAESEEPFFIYLPTNAPHGPYHDVPKDLREHYMKKDLVSLAVHTIKDPKRRDAEQDKLARIAAMITNEDQNVGRLITHLEKSDLLENTILIRINDNGPNKMRYVGEMRGMKSHVHEGGIRSPFWIHWPAKIPAGTTSDALTAHIDIMPTLLEACGAEPGPHAMDGRSFLGLFTAPEATEWPNRQIVIQSHRGTAALKYHHFMLRDDRWKLLHASGFGKESFEGEPAFELYDLKNDPKESKNLVTEKPKVFQRLKADYEAWFADVSSTRPDNYAPPVIIVGTEHENPTPLTRQDWRGTSWGAGAMGHWVVQVAKPVTADIEVILDPSSVTGNEAVVTLQVDAAVFKEKTAAGNVVFEGVEFPKGEVRLDAVRLEGDIETGAYQLMVDCMK
ncbi:MAG: arylsulfatase [Verrucomicrobiota bacterium]